LALTIGPGARRKGYATILVNLETRLPIDLLSDRSADNFAARLKQHPTVQLISRDRAETYADGATRGAPEAIQVADRFHLLCNLTSAIERIFETKRSELSKASTPGELKVDHSIPVETPTKMTGALERSKQRRECRLERYNKVTELHRQGMSN
jgi:transposase